MKSFQKLRAVCAVMLSSVIAAQAAPVDNDPGFKAGPRDTVAIERTGRDESSAQFAALTIDSADLNAGAEKPRAAAKRRVGPRGTIRRSH
jgi:hypothetical protein